MHTELNRRDVLKTIGGAGLAAVFGARALDFLGDDAQAATTCLLTPEVTEGPVLGRHLPHPPRRSLGKAGLPLVLRFTILNAKTCSVIKNADVEIWHCDALGNYSGVNGALDPLPPRPPEVERGRQGGVPDDLPRLVPRPHAAHPHEGLRRRQGGPHRADLLQREDHGSRLQAGSLRGPRDVRHAALAPTTSTSRRAARTRR